MRYWDNLRRNLKDHHVLTAGLTFMGFGTFTFIFSLMWVWGAVKATEPVVWIRASELGLCAVLMLYGLWRLWVETK